MRARQQTRLAQLSQHLAAQPLREDLVDAEFRKFVETGELPEDDLVTACALAEAEFNALLHSFCGEDDPEVLAAFDEAANAVGEQRAVALARLRNLAQQGRLLPRE